MTTIDEYAKERGLVPAIIDGAADRLRPVLLTTLTTVLGLAPLLFEKSQDAQFLKPTVITLVYGLGFGMILVLILVPAVIAMQQDLGKQFTALRRALRPRKEAWFVSTLTLLTAVGALGIFAGTLGAVITDGQLPQFVTNLLPVPPDAAMMPIAFAVFLVAVAIMMLGVFLLGALGFALRRRAV